MYRAAFVAPRRSVMCRCSLSRGSGYNVSADVAMGVVVVTTRLKQTLRCADSEPLMSPSEFLPVLSNVKYIPIPCDLFYFISFYFILVFLHATHTRYYSPGRALNNFNTLCTAVEVFRLFRLLLAIDSPASSPKKKKEEKIEYPPLYFETFKPLKGDQSGALSASRTFPSLGKIVLMTVTSGNDAREQMVAARFRNETTERNYPSTKIDDFARPRVPDFT